MLVCLRWGVIHTEYEKNNDLIHFTIWVPRYSCPLNNARLWVLTPPQSKIYVNWGPAHQPQSHVMKTGVLADVTKCNRLLMKFNKLYTVASVQKVQWLTESCQEVYRFTMFYPRLNDFWYTFQIQSKADPWITQGLLKPITHIVKNPCMTFDSQKLNFTSLTVNWTSYR